MKNKQKMIKIMATLGCAALFGGVGLGMQRAAAEDVELGGVVINSFRMSYGASVRIKDTEVLTDNGIRFAATISDEAHDALEALEETEGVTVKYGMIIVPYDYIENETVKVSELFTNANYCYDTSASHTECTKLHLASVSYDVLDDTDANDGVKDLRGSLVNVKQTNLTRRFTGVAYIAYTHDGTTEYALAPYACDENGENESILNNTRSMTHVAQMAVADDSELNSTKKELLTECYIKPFENYQFPYTINHYLPATEGEGYQTAIPEVLYGKLSQKVTASNIAKSSLPNKADYKAYATYSTTDDSNDSDIVYANGATVLNLYYKEVDTKIFDGTSADDITNVNTVLTGRGHGTAVASTAADAAGEGAAKITLNGTSNMPMVFNETQLEVAANANWDYITVKMYVETSVETLTSLNLSSRNVFLGNVPVGEWTDLVISKGQLNQSESYVVATSPEGIVLDKANFDRQFKTKYSIDTDTSLFWSNSATWTDQTVTYYIKEIRYGVDVTAPELVMQDLSAVKSGTFAVTPDVSDDYNSNITVTSTLYSIDQTTGDRTKVEANENGTYTLAAGKYYIKVTASDKTVTNAIGNCVEDEAEFTVTERTEPLFPETFSSAVSAAYFKNTLHAGTGCQTTVSYLDTHENASGVVKYDTTAVNYGYGAYMYASFSDEMIKELWKAFNTDGFTLTIRMWVDNDNLSSTNKEKGVNLYKKAYSYATTGTAFHYGQWTDFTYTAEQLTTLFGWAKGDTLDMTSAFYKQLTGQEYWWYVNQINKNAKITYYIDSISFTTGTATQS